MTHLVDMNKTNPRTALADPIKAEEEAEVGSVVVEVVIMTTLEIHSQLQ